MFVREVMIVYRGSFWFDGANYERRRFGANAVTWLEVESVRSAAVMSRESGEGVEALRHEVRKKLTSVCGFGELPFRSPR